MTFVLSLSKKINWRC